MTPDEIYSSIRIVLFVTLFADLVFSNLRIDKLERRIEELEEDHHDS